MTTVKHVDAPSSGTITELIQQKADPDLYSTWLVLFSEYNAHQEEIGGHKVNMYCRPCYLKVYLWWKRVTGNSE